MNEEMKRQIIKAFSEAIPINKIAEVTGVSKEGLVDFADDNKEAIAEMQSFRARMRGA